MGAGRLRRGGVSRTGGAGEGRARGSRGSPSGLGEAGRAIGGGGSPAGSAQSRESSGPAAVRRALGAASPRVPAAFREEAAPGPGATSPAGPSPPGGAERTEGRGPATHFSRSQRPGPREGCRLHGDRARGACLRTFGRGGEFLPRALCGGDGAHSAVCVPCQQGASGLRVIPERSRAVG